MTNQEKKEFHEKSVLFGGQQLWDDHDSSSLTPEEEDYMKKSEEIHLGAMANQSIISTQLK